MRDKFVRLCLLRIAFSAAVVGSGASTLAQTRALPRALAYAPEAGSTPGQPGNDAPVSRLGPPMPYAPRPLPGPAEAGAPVGGTDAQTPHGVPINLATAMQLAGVRPLDIEAA